MKVYLKSGEVIITEGDTPVLVEGLYKFDKYVDGNGHWSAYKPTNDPLIPAINISHIER